MTCMKERFTLRGRLIALNNWAVRRLHRRVDAAHLLVLLPRCLQRSGCACDLIADLDACQRCGQCDVSSLIRLRDATGVRFRLAGGGREAVDLTRRPDVHAVVACACEKELVEGIRAAFPKPVMGVVNRTPEGFCRNTRVTVERVAAVLSAWVRSPARK
jgi:hypothetical protein